MTTESEIVEAEAQENWKVKILVMGGVIGILAGLGAAYLLIQNSEKQGERPELTAGEGVKLGLWVFGLMRQISTLGGSDKD
jgi:hypothetical protein